MNTICVPEIACVRWELLKVSNIYPDGKCLPIGEIVLSIGIFKKYAVIKSPYPVASHAKVMVHLFIQSKGRAQTKRIKPDFTADLKIRTNIKFPIAVIGRLCKSSSRYSLNC